ncbi:hypothetical protein RRJ89_004358 [Vibrio parahaemolyticus]|nr:hypothetical protein [Vibrio parahaemolyticus]
MRKELVVNWAQILSEKLGRSAYELSLNGLTCADFPPDSIEIIFEDDSYCKFNYAFAVINEPRQEVAIFTEHCGYHVFSSLGVSVYECNDTSKKALLWCD